MPELTPEARAEIAEAIRIVREDQFDSYVRETLKRHAPKDEPPTPPTPTPGPTPPTPPTPGPTPPPPNPPTPEPPAPDPDKEYSRYWGEILR